MVFGSIKTKTQNLEHLYLHKMSKTKKVTISMTKETKLIAEKNSHKWNLKTLFKDKPNISGYITYLINREENESNNR